MKPWKTPDKGKKDVDTEPLTESIQNLLLRYDRQPREIVELS